MADTRVDEAGAALLSRAVDAHEGVVGDPQRYGPVAAEVLAAARAAGHVEAQVVALRAVAWYERSRLANRRAQRLLGTAARLARAADLPHRLGEVLVTKAAVDLELGRVALAQRDLDQAGDLVDARTAPDLELKRAALLHNLGRIGDASDGHRRVLANPDSSVHIRTRAANNLALAEALRGRTGEAMRHIEHAAELAAEVGPAFVAIVAHNRGQVLAQGGLLPESLRQFDESLELVRTAGLPTGEFLADHAEILAELRVLPEAMDVARRAVTELAAGEVPLIVAQAQLRVAEVALLAGDLETARGAALDAAERFRRQRRPGWTAMATMVAVDAESRAGVLTPARVDAARRAADTLGRLGLSYAAVAAELVAGRAALAVGRTALARRRLLATRDRARGGSVLMRLRGSLAAALAAEADGDPRAALGHCRAGLANLAQHRAALASMELRALAAGHGVELGLIGLGVLLRAGRPAQVLDWAERTRAVSLLTVEPPAPEDVREERAELAAVHTEIQSARRESGTEPAVLRARQRSIEQRIRRATWHRSAVGGAPAGAVAARELPPLLGERALVSFGRHEQELFAVVRHRGRWRLHRLAQWAPVKFEADGLLFALRRLTRPGSPRALESSRASAEHALARLAELLVHPLGLDPGVPLVVVPARGTHRIPWAALWPAPVSVAPSASLWARTAQRPAGSGEVVVIGGPGLPGAEREVAEVARQHRDARVMVPPASTVDDVLAAMEKADLVHLACHGLLRADNPTFSALEVTDGRLTVHELDLRGVAPRRIVLAACDSAADVAYAGDELLGFVGALLARGTAGLVASVVAVGDVEAVELMGALHAGLARGATMADALHAARAGVDRTDARGFVNWCAFTAYGAG